ncbi:hypothetical protein DFH06DRAFT_1473099 [Mycena polygramma]|nr:hypothetical protein DFH06DRAFT_1473099 [Mycena polygramma]
MDTETVVRIPVPDVLPLELWHEIAALTADNSDSHLIPWLSVAPGSVACHMHDAALAILFREVTLYVDDDPACEETDEAQAHLARILQRSEQCSLAVRRVDIRADVAGYPYGPEVLDKIALALTDALPRFSLLQDFFWDNGMEIHDFTMPPSVLRTLLSANRQLRRLEIGTVGPEYPRIDLAGLKELVELQVEYAGSPKILVPETLKTLYLTSRKPDGNHTWKTLVNNASSLSQVSLAYIDMTSKFWSRESPHYNNLQTIHLQMIKPPSDTGLDFSGMTALHTLHLRGINGLQSIGLLPICIRAPSTLRNLQLVRVSAARAATSLLLGLDVLSLHSLDLQLINLTSEDIDSIFVPGSNELTPPKLPFKLTRLKLCEATSPIVLRSSRPFPALRSLKVEFDRERSLLIDFFNLLGAFLGRANALETLAINAHEYECHRIEKSMVDSTFFLQCLEVANGRLRHFSFPVYALTANHPIFHELGNCLLHVPEISITCAVHSHAHAFTEDQFHLFSKFTELKHLNIHNLSGGIRSPFERTAIEILARHVPSLRTFTEDRNTSEIQRSAFSGEFQRVVYAPLRIWA